MEAKSSTVGRRPGSETSRVELLRAGAELLQENGAKALSAREAAIRAEVNPAMVRYFFRNRRGFLEALMDYGFETVMRDGSNGPEKQSLEGLIRSLHRTPWLAQLLVQTVYAGEELRAHFEAVHAPRLMDRYRSLLSEGQAAGHIRDDLPENLAIAGLISLIVFPVIAADSLGKLLLARPDGDLEDNAVALVMQLFARRQTNDPT